MLWAQTMSKRLAFLEKHTAAGSPGNRDPFAWYGLAMEYRSLSRFEESLATFTELRGFAPDYVPMYLMCAQVLQSLGRIEDARGWLSDGSAVARAKGDGHALSEMESALASL
jgi:hypothetical protein